MKCIKCGKDTVGSAVFCDSCLDDMAQHPVKPGTPVILPKRDSMPVVRHSRNRVMKPEQQILQRKKWICGLAAMIALLLVALTVSILLLVRVIEVSEMEITPQIIFHQHQQIVSRETILDK